VLVGSRHIIGMPHYHCPILAYVHDWSPLEVELDVAYTCVQADDDDGEDDGFHCGVSCLGDKKKPDHPLKDDPALRWAFARCLAVPAELNRPGKGETPT